MNGYYTHARTLMGVKIIREYKLTGPIQQRTRNIIPNLTRQRFNSKRTGQVSLPLHRVQGTVIALLSTIFCPVEALPCF